MDLVLLRIAAKRFRDAIECCDRSELSLGLRFFPRGSCGDVTPLLGAYLHDEGLGKFQYIHGKRGQVEPNCDRLRWTSHAWLQTGNIIVDITADQFDEVDEPIIVTDSPDWHNQFRREIKHQFAHYKAYDSETSATLTGEYQRIVENIVA